MQCIDPLSSLSEIPVRIVLFHTKFELLLLLCGSRVIITLEFTLAVLLVSHSSLTHRQPWHVMCSTVVLEIPTSVAITMAIVSRDLFFCASIIFLLEFHPVFQISDVVTGERSLYTGMFSLHVIAGGRQEDSISMFNTIDPM